MTDEKEIRDLSGEELGELAAVAALVPLAAPSVEPPAALAARVVAAVEREATPTNRRRFRMWRRPSFSLALAGAGAAVAAAALLLARPGGPPGSLELETALGARVGSVTATVEVRKTGIGRVISFRSDSLPILPKGDYYELWFVGPGDSRAHPNRISAGTFHPDEQGRSHVRLAAAVDPAKYPVLAVTAEPADGDPRPSGPEVLRSRRRG